MITTTSLKAYSVKDLAEMAKKKGVSGWHSMRKGQLIRALLKLTEATYVAGSVKHPKPAPAKRPSVLPRLAAGNGRVMRAGKAVDQCPKARSPRLEKRLKQVRAKLALSKDLTFRSSLEGNGHASDRLVVLVRDPYWLQAYWELTRHGVQRARAAMGQHWHGARPMLRVHEVAADGTTNASTRVVRHIEIHGGVSNWYVDVKDPPKTYQLDIGYLAINGKFYCLARSNIVTTPQSPAGETFDHHWAEVAQDGDHIFALSGGYAGESVNQDLREVFEEQLRRPMGPPLAVRAALGENAGVETVPDLNLAVEAELLIFGATEPGSQVTLHGEPVRLDADGSFMVRFNLPERRQVLPIVASSGDGGRQRTIVLAVERNTKVMESVVCEPSD